MPNLELVSHHLCPYVQRCAIALGEKEAPFARTYVDLGAKPEWFKLISPLGKVPLLRIDGVDVLFESAPICDYLDETIAPRLHPEGALERAKHRAWIEFASATLNDIAGYYNAPDAEAFEKKGQGLAAKFATLEAALGAGAYFAGARFSLVDAAFAPVFRYFEVFERFADVRFLTSLPKVSAWRTALAGRASVRAAVGDDYATRLLAFVRARPSHLARLAA